MACTTGMPFTLIIICLVCSGKSPNFRRPLTLSDLALSYKTSGNIVILETPVYVIQGLNIDHLELLSNRAYHSVYCLSSASHVFWIHVQCSVLFVLLVMVLFEIKSEDIRAVSRGTCNVLEQYHWKNHTNCLTYSCQAFKIKYKNTCFTNTVKTKDLPKARKFKSKADVLSLTCPLVCVFSSIV